MMDILLGARITEMGTATETWGRWTPGSGAPRRDREDLLRRKEVVQEGKTRSVVFPSWGACCMNRFFGLSVQNGSLQAHVCGVTEHQEGSFWVFVQQALGLQQETKGGFQHQKLAIPYPQFSALDYAQRGGENS